MNVWSIRIPDSFNTGFFLGYGIYVGVIAAHTIAITTMLLMKHTTEK